MKIIPEDRAFLGTTSGATIEYAGTTITCSAEIGGRTTKPASKSAFLTAVAFEPCESTSGWPTTVTSSASGAKPFPLVATKATGGGSGEGYMEIPFAATVVVKVYAILLWCEFTATGSQVLPGVYNVPWLEIASSLTVERTGGWGGVSECGPNKSTAVFKAKYKVETTPGTVEIVE